MTNYCPSPLPVPVRFAARRRNAGRGALIGALFLLASPAAAEPAAEALADRVASVEARYQYLATKEDLALSEGRINERLATIEERMEHVATKQDLAELRSELKGDTAGLRSELKDDIAGLRGEISALRGQFEGFKWLLPVLVGVLASFIPPLFGFLAQVRRDRMARSPVPASSAPPAAQRGDSGVAPADVEDGDHAARGASLGGGIGPPITAPADSRRG